MKNETRCWIKSMIEFTISNQEEIDSAVYIALSNQECFYSSNKFVFYLDYKIHEFKSFIGHSQVWATKEGAYILIEKKKMLDFEL